ncbi:hypothetical protein [Chryseobacterium sp. M5A1_1a]
MPLNLMYYSNCFHFFIKWLFVLMLIYSISTNNTQIISEEEKSHLSGEINKVPFENPKIKIPVLQHAFFKTDGHDHDRFWDIKLSEFQHIKEIMVTAAKNTFADFFLSLVNYKYPFLAEIHYRYGIYYFTLSSRPPPVLLV